jgi:hypothetical protein
MKRLLVGIMFLFTACKKNEPLKIIQEIAPCNLSPTSFEVIETLRNHPATVIIDSSHIYKLTIRSAHFPDGMLRPCNLPQEYWRNNLHVNITGSIYGLKNGQGQALPLELKSIEVRS